jgi:hypothetical protein
VRKALRTTAFFFSYDSQPLTVHELAERFVDGWDRSEQHRQDMLDPKWHTNLLH